MISIENNIDIPDLRTKPTAYPFKDMKVGDSFFVDAKQARAARTATGYYGRRYQRKFITRKATRDGKAGLRVWRVA